MSSTYTSMVTLLLAASTLPACALVWFLRPKPWRYILRGGEAVLAFAIAIDGARRLSIIGSGTRIQYPLKAWGIPGDVWAIFNVSLLSLVALLIWAKLDQVLRHRARNRQFAEQGKAELLARGIDIDAEIEEQKEAREPK